LGKRIAGERNVAKRETKHRAQGDERGLKKGRREKDVSRECMGKNG